MHINFDQAEDFEMLLAAEFGNAPQVQDTTYSDAYDAGYKIVDALACDLALDMIILDFDELN